MKEQAIIHLLRQSAEADFRYFSNPNKEVRERWVVSEFLTILGIPYQDRDLVSPEQKSKTDVSFLDANFQVKELTDPDLRRNKMYKENLELTNNAKTLEDLTKASQLSSSIPPITYTYQLVLEESKRRAQEHKYTDVKCNLDLLIYVTRRYAGLIQPQELNNSDFADLGWRSISCLNSKQAVVLFAAPAAPEFLRSKSRKIMRASNT